MANTYCSYCGQKAVSHLEPTLHDLIHETLHEFSHVDGKILSTMKLLLFKPGQLTAEFLNGRRTRYVSPVRLYLTMSLIYFVLSSFSPSTLMHAGPVEAKKGSVYNTEGVKTDIQNAYVQQMVRGVQRLEKNHEIFSEHFNHAFPKMLFVMVPIFAALLWLSYRRARRPFVPYLYFSLHYHAALFTGLLVVSALRGWEVTREMFVRPLWMLWAIIYLAIALRRVFGGKHVYWRATTALFSYSVIFVTGVVCVLAFEVYQLGA